MRSVAAILVMAVVLAAISCGSKGDGAAKTDTTTHKVQAPDMGLHEAALRGELRTIEQHIAAGSRLDEKDTFGSTPLIVAATFGQTEVAKALIDAGADLSAGNKDGATALHAAAFFCRPGIVSALLEKGADKTIRDKFGSTPYDAVAGPFEEVKPVYDMMGKMLAPMGLRLDYEYLKETRPIIAEMLK